jgi:hypothetical protein
MAMPVASMLKHFRPEFERHMDAARERRDLTAMQAMGAEELGAEEDVGAQPAEPAASAKAGAGAA